MTSDRKQSPASHRKELVAVLKKEARKRGYLLYDHINDRLPEEFSGDIDFVEALFAQLEKAQVLIVNSDDEYVSRTGITVDEPESRFREEEIHLDPIKRYFYEMGKRPLLSTEEERAAATLIADLTRRQIRLAISFPFVCNGTAAELAYMINSPENRKAFLGEDFRNRKTLNQFKQLVNSLEQGEFDNFVEIFHTIAWKENPCEGSIIQLHTFTDRIHELDRRVEELSGKLHLTEADKKSLLAGEDTRTNDPSFRALAGQYRTIEEEATVNLEQLRQDLGRWIAAEWELQQAKNHLTEANLRLVIAIAKKFMNRGMSLLDLIQEGNLGLMKAVDKFDHTRGYKFSTYATWWIRQAISRAIADQSRTVRIPVHLIDQIQRAVSAKHRLTHAIGREPTDQELSADLEITIEKLQHLMTVARDPVSLDRTSSDEERSDLSDTLVDENQMLPLDQVIQDDLRQQIQTMLRGLSLREAEILRRRYGLDYEDDNLTLEEVGKHFDVTRERIRQIESTALRKLRNPARLKALKEFYDS